LSSSPPSTRNDAIFSLPDWMLLHCIRRFYHYDGSSPVYARSDYHDCGNTENNYPIIGYHCLNPRSLPVPRKELVPAPPRNQRLPALP
ncbi:hypothetical protein PFISCL1PPCAC_1469, partial [Pristionchus fissidentatus]